MPAGIYIRTEEHNRNISKANKGKNRGENCSEETRRKLSEALKGKRFSENHRKKLSESHQGIKLSEKAKQKLRDFMTGKFGKDATNWKGGISTTNNLIRNSLDYKEWRIMVFGRDNYTCQECGNKNGNGKDIYLEAHHIKSFAEYLELRFEISNGITLCEDCHKIENKKQMNGNKNGYRN